MAMLFRNIILILSVFLGKICAEYDFDPRDVVELHGSLLAGTFVTTILRNEIRRGRSSPRATANNNSVTFPKVQTTSGVATGVTTDTGHEFYEIPYAKPPVGNLRWMEPQPIEQPNDIDATANDYIFCYQYPSFCSGDSCPVTLTEDCLVLNVFIPKTVALSANESDVPTDRLAVMFYIHGGSFKIGAGSDPTLHGAELANVTNNIVVVINYRLGALGFLSHEQSGQPNLNGNQGIKDQRLAMQWVQDNIGNFGGDKNRVMIFGNSAGAQSVMIHTLSPLSRDLYSNSLQQSNPHIYSFFYPDQDIALRISDKLVRAMGCNGTSTNERHCLLNSSAEDITSQMPLVEILNAAEEGVLLYLEETFMPVVDGADLTAQPVDLYRTGQWNADKNAVMGVNTQESENTQYVFDVAQLNATAFTLYNIGIFGAETGAAIAEKYINDFPPPKGEDYKTTLGMEFSHYYYDCPNRLMARYASNSSQLPVYFYANSHPVLNDACVRQNNGNKTGCYIASHASETAYVFRTVPENDNFTEDDQIVENEFSTYWGSFARTGDPSSGLENSLGDFPSWPAYAKDAQNGGSIQPWTNIHITSPSSVVESGYKEDICDFWDGINYGIQAPATSTSTSAPTLQSSTNVSQSAIVSTSAPTESTIVSTTSKGHQAVGSLIITLGVLILAAWRQQFNH